MHSFVLRRFQRAYNLTCRDGYAIQKLIVELHLQIVLQTLNFNLNPNSAIGLRDEALKCSETDTY